MTGTDLNLPKLMFAGALAAISLVVPVFAQTPSLTMLDGLQKGSWTLRDRTTGAERKICIRSGRELIQLRHTQPGCDRVVVQDEANEVTVQYTCRGNGYGRTSVRREDPRLVQVRSQGIYNGAPFSIEGEARYIGSC